jgi:hypothetical protein
MLLPALRTSLAILVLRAGPQDMPYDPGPRLLREVLLFTLACYTAFWMLLLPPAAAVALAAIVIAGQMLTARLSVASRKFENRLQQTLTALLLSNALLVLSMLPVCAVLAPYWKTIYAQLLQNPDLMNHPEKLPLPPPLIAFLFQMQAVWLFATWVRVLGRAIEINVLGAICIATLSLFTIMLFITLMSPLLASLAS